MRTTGSSEPSNRETSSNTNLGHHQVPKGENGASIEKNRKKLKKIAIMNKPNPTVTKNGFKSTLLAQQFDFLNSPSSINVNVLNNNSEINASEYHL